MSALPQTTTLWRSLPVPVSLHLKDPHKPNHTPGKPTHPTPRRVVHSWTNHRVCPLGILASVPGTNRVSFTSRFSQHLNHNHKHK